MSRVRVNSDGKICVGGLTVPIELAFDIVREELAETELLLHTCYVRYAKGTYWPAYDDWKKKLLRGE